MSPEARLWPLVPAGKCRTLLFAAWALATASALLALVPAIAVYGIALVLFERVDIRVTVIQLVFLAIASVIARLGLQLLGRLNASTAAALLSASLRARAAAKIGSLPLGDLAAAGTGAFETTLLDDVETIGAFFSERSTEITGAYAMTFAAAAILAARDWRLAAVAIVLAAAGRWFYHARAHDGSRNLDGERASRERLAATVFGAVRSAALERALPARGGERPIRAIAAEYRSTFRGRRALEASLGAQRRAFSGSIAAIAVLAALALPHAVAGLTTIVLFSAVGLRISGAVVRILTATADIAPARASARRIGALLARPSIPEGTVGPPPGSSLRFEDVSFSYPGRATGRAATLTDVDFVAEAGKVTAIVGPSGSGKTTLLRLAARFWDVDRGAVRLDGVDVRDVPVDALMRRIACVFQDVALLDDSVAANLRLGSPEATAGDLERAALAAGAHAFVAALPDGYQTIVGDRGLHLSRGERQRLQIARALLKDAPIVILDEATASLDPATEADIHDALVPLLAGKTVLVVAHRLSTVTDADRIVVLDARGSVEAQGTHDELVTASPTYARLWTDYRASIDWAPPAETVA